MGIPVVLVGLALIGLGAWMWDREHQPTDSPRPTVVGTSVVAPTSTTPTTPTTLLPVESLNGSTVPVAPPVGSAGGSAQRAPRVRSGAMVSLVHSRRSR